DADELDGNLGDFLDGEGGAAAGVAVELGQDDAVEVQRVVERLGAVDGVLAGHGVADQVHLVGPDQPVDLPQLVHRHLGDVQPAGGVEDDGVQELGLGVGDGVAADVHRGGVGLAVDGDVDLAADDLELVHGRGPLEVGGDQEGLAAALLEGQGQLAAGG